VIAGRLGELVDAFLVDADPVADANFLTDQRTQVRWGIRDFESRFGRKPEGMWLPETAVDLETLGGIYRVAGFLVVGLILLVVSFLYQRNTAAKITSQR